ncbi:RNA polymerase sigma factor [Streptomyces sp. NPDC001691]|uniref:RNA polymerase sigma factor n=1 Tax=unclassified Streptomyces TaxID=2593676 RepID=UPI001CB8F767|nr:sigma-70 family RNA polymerase sigma factor [Streptomyces sp. SDr-06]
MREDLAAALPADFVAFYSTHHRTYLRYAHLQLGARELAEGAVEDVFVRLAVEWPHVLRRPSVQAYAWAALQDAVGERLRTLARGRALVQTASFAAARDALRTEMETLETGLGLYAAIARLPERHYDAIVLHYVLGYPQREVAAVMGISYPTVRSHLRGARRRLARDLRLAWYTDSEET